MTTTTQTTTPTPPAPRRPRTLRTVLLVVGSVLLAAVLLLVGLQVASAGDDQDHSRTTTVGETVDRLTVDAAATDVTIRRADVDRPRIVFAAGDTRLRERHSVRDGALTVEVTGPGWGITDLSIGVRRGADLTIELPRAATGTPVRVETTAGDVTLTGRYGAVDLTSTQGDVSVSGSAEAVTVTATSGDVGLDLGTAPSRITVDTTSGDQEVRLPRGEYAITAETTVGDVENALGTDPDADRRYRFTAVAGDVDVEAGDAR